MKYYLTLIRRNPSEVLRKVFGLVKEKVRVKYGKVNKVVIYSLGKAGTSSIYEVLRYLKNVDARHVHYLSELPDEINQWRVLEKIRAVEVKKWFKDGDTTIISLVRDPFSRSVSSVIQNYELYHKKNDFSNAIVENARTISLNWWDEEFLKSMNWDVYKYPFDKNKGYTQYSLGNGNNLIIIKSTHISSVGFHVLSKALKIDLREKRVNGSSNKYAAIKHKEVIEEFKFKKSDFDFITESKFMKHFYSDDEMLELRKHWT